MMPVVWLDEALADLRAVGDYIARDNREAAYRVLRHTCGDLITSARRLDNIAILDSN
jgi:plasmid stabilization system protein ParE